MQTLLESLCFVRDYSLFFCILWQKHVGLEAPEQIVSTKPPNKQKMFQLFTQITYNQQRCLFVFFAHHNCIFFLLVCFPAELKPQRSGSREHHCGEFEVFLPLLTNIRREPEVNN